MREAGLRIWKVANAEGGEGRGGLGRQESEVVEVNGLKVGDVYEY